MIELKEGTFLVLEMTREYENSGKWVRVQGKYLPVIRRGILWDYGLLSGDNRQPLIISKDYGKTIKDYDNSGRLWKIIDDYGRSSMTIKHNEEL